MNLRGMRDLCMHVESADNRQVFGSFPCRASFSNISNAGIGQTNPLGETSREGTGEGLTGLHLDVES